MLLHRYRNIDFVLQLDADIGIPLIHKALNMDRDDRIFMQWVAQLPVMSLTGFSISLADYRDKVTGANIDRRPVAQLNAEIDEVEKLLKGGEIYGT